MDAPNFNGNYPGAGERIGPAWRAAWRLLEPGHPVGVDELLTRMTEAGDVQAGTAHNLLRVARSIGLLKAQYEPTGHPRRVRVVSYQWHEGVDGHVVE